MGKDSWQSFDKLRTGSQQAARGKLIAESSKGKA
jgi:hypothetical protein